MENIIYYNHFTSFHAIFLALQAHLSSERNEGRAIRFMHEASFCGSEFLSLSLSFFCDNGLFLTRGASQNLRKRCHGKKRGGGEQISPCSYGLCISCMARGILFKDCIQMRRGGENKNRVSLEGVSRKHRRMDGVMRTIRHGFATLLFSR